jgi:hypothetical protein
MNICKKKKHQQVWRSTFELVRICYYYYYYYYYYMVVCNHIINKKLIKNLTLGKSKYFRLSYKCHFTLYKYVYLTVFVVRHYTRQITNADKACRSSEISIDLITIIVFL